MFAVEDYLVQGKTPLIDDINADIRYFVESANKSNDEALIKKAEMLKVSAEHYFKKGSA